jgi:hypothetical protein
MLIINFSTPWDISEHGNQKHHYYRVYLLTIPTPIFVRHRHKGKYVSMSTTARDLKHNIISWGGHGL